MGQKVTQHMLPALVQLDCVSKPHVMVPGHTILATYEPVASLKGSCRHFSVDAGICTQARTRLLAHVNCSWGNATSMHVMFTTEQHVPSSAQSALQAAH